MTIDIKALKIRHQELVDVLHSGHIDGQKRRELQKELGKLSNIIDAYTDVEKIKKMLDDTYAQKDLSDDEEMRQLFVLEIENLIVQKKEKEAILEDMLLPKDEHDDRSIFLEIRSGTGGQEAALFAADLVKMYSTYADSKQWRVTIVSESLTDLGGIRDITLHIEGKNVYGHLKFEAGVHRVQRVPKTETQGRVHTSTATVAVFPEAKEVDVTINPADLRIDVFRASGAGGQHVNTTDSAVRITHLPTGVVVSCQDERSQLKNKNKALKMLQSRILAHEKEKHESEMGQKRREMVGGGARAEKVRTYNFPQNRVTDHRINLTLKKLDRIILGDLNDIVVALCKAEKEEQKKVALQK